MTVLKGHQRASVTFKDSLKEEYENGQMPVPFAVLVC